MRSARRAPAVSCSRHWWSWNLTSIQASKRRARSSGSSIDASRSNRNRFSSRTPCSSMSRGCSSKWRDAITQGGRLQRLKVVRFTCSPCPPIAHAPPAAGGGAPRGVPAPARGRGTRRHPASPGHSARGWHSGCSCPREMEARRATLEVEALHDISKVLSVSTDLSKAFTSALLVLRSHVGLENGTVSLFDPVTGEVFIEAAPEIPDAERILGRLRPGEGIVGRVFRTGVPVAIPDLAEEPVFLNLTGSWRDHHEDRRALFAVPCARGAATLGVLTAERRWAAGPFSFDRDLRAARHRRLDARRAAAAPPARGPEGACARGGAAGAAGPRAVPRRRRGERPLARGARRRRARRPEPCDRAPQGGERHREGGGRARAPRSRSAGGAPVRRR